MKNNVLLILVLCEKLGGNKDLANYIFNLKVKHEKDDIFFQGKDYWIENNFYNWLSYDLLLRKGIELLEYNHNFPYFCYEEFYRIHNPILGFNLHNNEYRRTKSLNKCFNDKWWMCTEKASIKWRDIHRIIHSKIRVYEIDRSELFQEIMIDYYFANNLLYELFGIKRIKYINKLYNHSIINGGFFFDDIEFIYGDPFVEYQIQFFE
jgi:hypothetical protein